MNTNTALSFASLAGMPVAASTPSPAPIHDIVGPLPFFPYTTQQLVLAFVVLLLLLGGIAWGVWKRFQKPPLTPSEVALQALAAMKQDLMAGDDHDFGICVSNLLRNYLGDVFGFAAPRQTTEEFLNTLHQQKRFALLEQEALRDFLKQSDVLKFAQGALQAEERLALIECAEKFIQGGNEEQKK